MTNAQDAVKARGGRRLEQRGGALPAASGAEWTSCPSAWLARGVTSSLGPPPPRGLTAPSFVPELFVLRMPHPQPPGSLGDRSPRSWGEHTPRPTVWPLWSPGWAFALLCAHPAPGAPDAQESRPIHLCSPMPPAPGTPWGLSRAPLQPPPHPTIFPRGLCILPEDRGLRLP